MIEKINYFIEKGLMAHIKLSSGRFYNGVIKKIDEKNFITIDDRFCGIVHIFLNDVETFEEFVEVKE